MENYPVSSMENTCRLTEDLSKLLILTTMTDWQKTVPYEGGEDLPFLSEVVWRRITVMNFPIKFTLPALISINCFCAVPGAAVVLLCECLSLVEKRENKLITVADLVDIYPNGGYNQDTLRIIIDDYMKTKKHPYSHLY
jgi:hypothetical protein